MQSFALGVLRLASLPECGVRAELPFVAHPPIAAGRRGEDFNWTSGEATGFNQDINVDVAGAGSPIQVTTGAGMDWIQLTGTLVNNANVVAGGGNDRVQIADNGGLHSGVHLDGGDGIDTLY